MPHAFDFSIHGVCKSPQHQGIKVMFITYLFYILMLSEIGREKWFSQDILHFFHEKKEMCYIEDFIHVLQKDMVLGIE